MGMSYLIAIGGWFVIQAEQQLSQKKPAHRGVIKMSYDYRFLNIFLTTIIMTTDDQNEAILQVML